MKSGDSLNLVAHQTWERMAQKTEKSVGSSDLNRGSQTLLPILESPKELLKIPVPGYTPLPIK